MSSTASSNTPIPVPSCVKAIDDSFADHILNSIFEINFPLDDKGNPTGDYFKNHVNDFGSHTRLFFNVGQILWETSTDGVPEADHMASMSLTSIKFIQNIDYILKKLSEALPAKLATLNWRGKTLSPVFYNNKQFRGKDKTTGRALYGAPSCILVLEMEPIPGTVAVCKPKRTFVREEEEEEEDKAPPPKPKATAAYRNAAAAAAPPAPVPAAGGGGGVYRGKPKIGGAK